ncbi:hypothetical protein B0A55_11260 [Friedmanniomyces simplex]|uniref:Uncharacterized protein n=1 Tax=Friedmanniomyces simplex TaxID=329884 RepID=A0A4U0WQG3_9PEZI|nr:hypothetical protein B0A55_11260 [Friedmanniomyces simplex]
MSRYDKYDRDYDSDDSTLVNEARYGRRSRRSAYRSPSEDSASSPRRSYYDDSPPKQERGSERSDGLGKATLAVGLLAALAGLFHLWNVRRRKEQEREERQRRREKFARAKAARRREEERRERGRRGVYEEAPSEMLRIGDAPVRRDGSRERARGMRMIEGSAADVEADEDRGGERERRHEENRRSRRER